MVCTQLHTTQRPWETMPGFLGVKDAGIALAQWSLDPRSGVAGARSDTGIVPSRRTRRRPAVRTFGRRAQRQAGL